MFSKCCCRWYIDPAESVMTYHNFVTGERIFDYQMKDKKLREICIENMYGKLDSQCYKLWHAQRRNPSHAAAHQ
jgi:hypothetical protein